MKFTKAISNKPLAIVGIYPPPYGGVGVHLKRLVECLDRFRSCYSPELARKYSWKHIAELTMHSYEAAIGSRDSN